MIKLIIDCGYRTKHYWQSYAASRNRPLGMAVMMFLRKDAEQIIRKFGGRRIKKPVNLRGHLKKRVRKTRFWMVDGK